jgi:hypothetical protein
MTNVDLARAEFAFVTINHFSGARPSRSRHPGPPLPRPARGAEPDRPIRGMPTGPGRDLMVMTGQEE